MEQDSRFDLVSSLYGPGTVGACLLIVCSVLFTWIIGPNSHQDKITNDLIAALSLPMVASGHLFYQTITFPASSGGILLTKDPILIPKVAALEAALNVCDTAQILALIMFGVALTDRHRTKQAVAVAITGMTAFLAQIVLFIREPDATISSSNLTRPFILNVTALFITVTVLSVITCVALLVIWLWTSLYQHDYEQASVQIDGSTGQQIIRPNPSILPAGGEHNSNSRRVGLQSASARVIKDAEGDRRGARTLSLLGILFLPFGVLASGVSFGASFGLFGETDYYKQSNRSDQVNSIIFFIPRTGTSLKDLDQVVALSGGALTLFFSVREALRKNGG